MRNMIAQSAAVNRESRQIRRVPDVLEAQERLASLVSDSIRPRLVPNLKGGAVAELEHDCRSGPSQQYLSPLSPAAGAGKRRHPPVGSASCRAEALRIEELKRWNRMDSLGGQAIPDLKPDAIDFRAASEFFAPFRKLTPKAWSTLRVTTKHQGRDVATAGGLLLSGKDRFSRYPDARLRVMLLATGAIQRSG
ncbi:MAG: hypothetical protein IPJ98_09255 [Bryobacterales bacterium]|nr:hypothetical protein [Bryobacterales bacterium]